MLKVHSESTFDITQIKYFCSMFINAAVKYNSSVGGFLFISCHGFWFLFTFHLQIMKGGVWTDEYERMFIALYDFSLHLSQFYT